MNSQPAIGRSLCPLTLLVLVAFAIISCTNQAGNSPEMTKVPSPATIATAIPTATAALSLASVNLPTPSAIPDEQKEPNDFDGEKAFRIVEDQMKFGPRWPGSPGHTQIGNYIVGQLQELGWEVEEQRFVYNDVIGRNIIGRSSNDGRSPIMLGAHYDTRKIADQTPGSAAPVPGAVDGASGVAVLLELARSLDVSELDSPIWLSFFDLEDNGSGGVPGYDWIVGSTYMAENLTVDPKAMVLVDMVGDADQQLYLEGNSDPNLQLQLWELAEELGYGDYFIQEYRYNMTDDHIPFARLGISAVDIIDFDYPYWHTIDDTLDKVSPSSLTRVGRTIEVWLEGR